MHYVDSNCITFRLRIFGYLMVGVIGSFCSLVSASEDVLDDRVNAEIASLNNAFIITQHANNYVLPYTVMDEPNQEPYLPFGENFLQKEEAKYQISMKAPIYNRRATELEGLYFAFTAKSWWQVYSSETSRPFRETNYEPELFYSWYPEKRYWDSEWLMLRLGLNHQSNGESSSWSRSWNRVFVSAMAENSYGFGSLRLWYRIPEDKKETPDAPKGDDNPDIEHYLGHFELRLGTKFKEAKMTMMMRNNLRTENNRGYMELNFAYPINKRFDLLFQYVNGYGESLIDYNHDIERFGIGFQLADY